jgi:hypothetical protein
MPRRVATPASAVWAVIADLEFKYFFADLR